MLLVLYGSPGAGKSFVGKWLARTHDFYFYDADIDLTEDMKHCLYNKQPFTQSMRDHFFKIVISHVRRLQRHYPKLVIAQAISQKVNRDQLYKAFPEACFIHVEASMDILLKRLEKRGDWVTPDWVNKLLDIQEAANPEHACLDNSLDCLHLARQMKKILR